jgi:DNA polymerase-3 subunit delta'
MVTQNISSTHNWNIFGHEWAISQFRRAIANNRIRQAYLFAGLQSIGKTSLALAFAQALNCREPNAPCGTCRTCKLIAHATHSDLNITQSEYIGASLKIDQIRELQRWLSLRPYEANYKVSIIRRFHEAKPIVQDAILKTLEEPPQNAVLILTTEYAEQLLPTIISRCQVLNLRPLSFEDTENALSTIAAIDRDQIPLLAKLSGGRLWWAIRVVNDEKELELRQSAIQLLEEALTSNRRQRFSLAEKLAKDKPLFFYTLDIWTSYWRDVLLLASGSSVPIVNIDYEDNLQHVAAQLDTEAAQEAIGATQRTAKYLRANVNNRLGIEILLLDYPFIKS